MPVTAPPPSDTQYKPLSSLAVWGLLFGLASPIVFLIGKAWPVFFICLPGLILSVMARRQIRAANGALAGHIPATFGVVLCVACGLGWVVHDLTESLILETESRRFVDDWLAKLRAGDDAGAFLACVEPAKRRIDFEPTPRNLKVHFPPAEGGTAPQYDVFRFGKFSSLLLRLGDQVQLTPLGRPELKDYVKLDQQMKLTYRYAVKSPLGEGTGEVVLVSASVPVPSGFRREWQILHADLKQTAPSELGARVAEVTQSAEFAMDRMTAAIIGGDRAGLEKMFRPGANFADAARLFDAMRIGAAANALVTFKVRKPMLLLHDEQKGKGWQVTLRGQFENDLREVEFEVDLETPDLAKEQEGWKCLGCRLLGERRRVVAEPTLVPMPPVPAIPEGFRNR